MTDAAPNEPPFSKDRKSHSYYCCSISSGGLQVLRCWEEIQTLAQTKVHFVSFGAPNSSIKIVCSHFHKTNSVLFYPNRIQSSYLKDPAVDVNSLKAMHAEGRTAPIWSSCRVITEVEPTL